MVTCKDPSCLCDRAFRATHVGNYARPRDSTALESGRLAVVDESDTIRVWHTKTNKLLGEYTSDLESSNNYGRLAFHPGGGKLVASHFDPTSRTVSPLVFDLDFATGPDVQQ